MSDRLDPIYDRLNLLHRAIRSCRNTIHTIGLDPDLSHGLLNRLDVMVEQCRQINADLGRVTFELRIRENHK